MAFAAAPARAVADADTAAPKVFLDCADGCSSHFIQVEIPFVGYVRDRTEADVHVLVTTQTTGASGKEYTLSFMGLGPFEDVKHTLRFVSQKDEPEERVQSGLVRTLKAGLVPYLAQTRLLSQLEVSVGADQAPQKPPGDPWNSWVVTLEGRTELNGERSERNLAIDAELGADRVTADWKLSFALEGDHDEDRFDTDDGRIVSVRREQEARALVVKSLGQHWSAGASASAFSSTFRNIDLSLRLSPTVEYDVFPYAESTRRELRLMYSVDLKRASYREETLYGKLSETIPSESLSATLNQKEPWGTLGARLEATHDFRDLHKYRVDLSGEVRLRLTRGLSLDVAGNVSRVRDQLSIPRRGVSVEEQLLRQRELASNYEYQLEVGLSYSFGSIFNHVVNPRFGE